MTLNSTAATIAPGGADCSCSEFLSVSRRGLLRSAALVGAVTTIGSSVVTMSTGGAFAAAPARSVVVVLSLRGAADGLSLVVPHGDPAYAAARPTIAVPRGSLLGADAYFGMHPAMAPLMPLWNAGKLAAVHATGLPAPNRSHFSAMEQLEDADPGSAERIGWLNRLLGQDTETSAVQGLAMGAMIPTSLQGAESSLSMMSLAEVGITGNDSSNKRLNSMALMWGNSPTAYGAGVRSAISASTDLKTAQALPNRSSTYPDSDLGRALADVARTLRADVGVTAVTVDSGDWDMHSDLGTVSAGWMARNATDLAGAIAAFFADLEGVADKVTLVTISEFGRRVQENGSRGLDHGWGNVMLVAGAGVKGGKYYAKWPGLTNSLDADLQVTTDYRSVLSEIVTSRMGASRAAVFPGFSPQTVGVMAGA
ncbi:DUF1501 domain-containing protein [Nocardioides sp. R-C-SC26]|uniref:DUF1501 domain-containing protein n=1 Tax=Nocardioides sp. R-C-SC26 TaxID=2870414 RepID=UPI001E474FDA|nr:DUF1501 domain-containing protein [Nocardioides sp. R-C-SC26]